MRINFLNRFVKIQFVMAFIKVKNLFEKIKVQIVSENPDLCVYVTKSKIEAGGKDEYWYYVELGQDKTVTFVDKNPDIKG